MRADERAVLPRVGRPDYLPRAELPACQSSARQLCRGRSHPRGAGAELLERRMGTRQRLDQRRLGRAQAVLAARPAGDDQPVSPAHASRS